MSLTRIITTILTTSGKNNDAYWALARHVATARTDADTTYDVIASAWRKAQESEPAAILPCPKASTVRQLGASHKIWGAVATGAHSPFHAYAWRSLGKPKGPDGKATQLEDDALRAAWDSIPANRPKPKSAAAAETVSVKLDRATYDALSAIAVAAGITVPDVIQSLVPKS